MIATDQLLKEEFERGYRFYSDSKNEIDGINTEIKDVISEIAKKMDLKPAILKKVYGYKHKLAKKGEDDISDIQEVLAAVEGK